MAIILGKREMKWLDRYWVQPGEIVIKIDGGQTRDANGTPNIYPAGNLVKPRVRLFPQKRKQEIVVFDARRQAEPVHLLNQTFPLCLEPLTLTLTASAWYRIRDPLPLLEGIAVNDDVDISQMVWDRVHAAIGLAVQNLQLQSILGAYATLREQLLRDPLLMESPIAIEDIAIGNLEIPLELLELRSGIEAHLAQNRSAVDTLRARGVLPTFDYMRQQFPAYIQQLLARTREIMQRVLGLRRLPESTPHLTAFVADVWNAWLSKAGDADRDRESEGVLFTNESVAAREVAESHATTPTTPEPDVAEPDEAEIRPEQSNAQSN